MARFVPYGRAIYNLRRAREPIGLLIVATSWGVGKFFEGNERVKRCVIPDDVEITAGNIIFMVGLDVLVCPDYETPDDRLNEVIESCFKFGRASQVWLMHSPDELFRMSMLGSEPVAVSDAIPLSELAQAIKLQQQVMMLHREGIYSDPATHDALVRQLMSEAADV